MLGSLPEAPVLPTCRQAAWRCYLTADTCAVIALTDMLVGCSAALIAAGRLQA